MRIGRVFEPRPSADLEAELRRVLSQMPLQTFPEALDAKQARSAIRAWRDRHWLDETAQFLP